MGIYSRGVAKLVAIGVETTFGVPSSAAGQLLRRVQSDLNLNVQVNESQEILPSQQIRDSRQGPRQVQGTISGQVSPTTYNMLFEGLLRGTFATGGSLTGITGSTATVDGNGNLNITSGSSNFPAAFKIGDVVRISGLTGAPATGNNGQDMRIIGMIGSTVMSLSPAGTAYAWSSGQTIGIAVPGKKLIVPATGQVDRSFTIEHWYSDINKSEVFTGCKVTQLSLNIPASGFVTMQASFTGQNAVESNSRFFTNPAAATATTSVTSNSGAVAYNNAELAYINSMNIQIATQVGADPVVGSNLVPDIFLGTLSVRGSLTAMFKDDSMTSDFNNEVEVNASALLTTSAAPTADFVSFHLPRVKMISSSKNDTDRAITRSYSFMGLENTGTQVYQDATSIMIQDSLQA